VAKKIITAFVVLLAAVCLPGAIITAVAGGSLLGAFGDRLERAENVNVRGRWSRTITTGRPFELIVEVTNGNQESLTLHSIDLDADFVKAMTITGSEPPFERSELLPGFTSYRYGLELPPGRTDITIEAVTLNTGTYPFTMDVCINSPVACFTIEAEIVVR
jgi:hypothetical protein